MEESILQILLLRFEWADIQKLGVKQFAIGLCGTWLVGMGRYWDDDKASLLQHAGFGSVIYIFVLAAFIWLMITPYKIKDWNYFKVLTFISLTSFPAAFYAIPVEKFCTIQLANKINVWFLAIVAFWRLCLLFRFLKVFTRLDISDIVTITFMPVCVIISVLTMLNLHHVVFNIMGGVRQPTPHDASYGVLMVLTGFSMLAVIPLLFSYIFSIYQRRKRLARNHELS